MEIRGATQAIQESNNQVLFLLLGKPVVKEYLPIEVACSKCTEVHFGDILKCREYQKKDATARGFTQIVCPNQFIE